MRNKPVADNLTATKMELEKVKKERHSYKKDLESEKLWKRKEDNAPPACYVTSNRIM